MIILIGSLMISRGIPKIIKIFLISVKNIIDLGKICWKLLIINLFCHSQSIFNRHISIFRRNNNFTITTYGYHVSNFMLAVSNSIIGIINIIPKLIIFLLVKHCCFSMSWALSFFEINGLYLICMSQ